MNKNQSAKNSFIIGLVILAIITSIFTIYYYVTKKKIENFHAVLGKEEKVDFSVTVQTILSDNKYGTAEENVRYAALTQKEDIIVIKEKMFITQTNEIYLNFDDYLGKTVKLEGIFKTEKYYDDKEPYCFVIRYGPGCCGFDSNAGFEVKWDKNHIRPYPAVDSWVEATGVLKVEEDGNAQYLYLDLSSLDVLSKRGAEVVMQ
jgi:uncharacterized membrane protein YcgQ (UPF0703/DUF1980 family)